MDYMSREDYCEEYCGIKNREGYKTCHNCAMLNVPSVDVQPVNQWISCQDKMPEEYKTVLVYEKDYGVMIGELEKKFFDTQYFIARKSGLILRTTEVTHWQPLPEPPKQ